MGQYRLTLRCATEAEVRAVRAQLEDGVLRYPGVTTVDAGDEVEVDVQLPGGAAALLSGVCGRPGPAGVAISLDPVTPNALEAIERAAREIDPPTRRATGYGAEPETQRVPRMEVPPEAYRDPPPKVIKRPPALPPLPKPVAKPAPVPKPVPVPAPRHTSPTVPAPVTATVVADQLLDTGRHDEALAAFQRRLRVSPTDRAAAVGLEIVEGLLARDRGDRFEAAQRFEAALAIDPDDTRAAALLTEIRRQVVEQRLAGLTKLVDREKP